jgi:CelD/BcsL family acetyltransferase involved in cellulose biosynthesis
MRAIEEPGRLFTMALQIQMRDDPALFGELAEEWTDLLGRSLTNSFFTTPQWQEIWWQHFGGDLDLVVLLARDEAGTLVGIAPLYAFEQEGQRILQLVGGVEVSDYLDFIIDREWEEAVYRAFLMFLQEEQAPDWQVLDLHCLPGDSPTRTDLLCGICEECCPGAVEAQEQEAAPYIPLPDDWEVYLANLDKKQRHEIRRKMRRAARETQVEWYRVQDQDRLEKEVEIFLQLHRASHPEKDAFMTPQMEAFFRDMAQVTLEAGWLSLYTIKMDDNPVASMWCFDYGDDLLVYNSGYDPSWRPELSSGIVLLSYCIQDAIERGKKRFDFMRGDEAYKYRFGAVHAAVYRLIIHHPDG